MIFRVRVRVRERTLKHFYTFSQPFFQISQKSKIITLFFAYKSLN